jgi:signal transduction histidine kinase
MVLFVVAGTLTVSITRASDQSRVSLADSLQPAQTAVDGLTKSLLEQQSGVRGYELTGQTTFLAPYTGGLITTLGLFRQLQTELNGHKQAMSALGVAMAAADYWNAKAAEPGVVARRAGTATPTEILNNGLLGQFLFAIVQARMVALNTAVSAEVTNLTAEVNNDNGHLNLIALVTLCLAILLALGLFVALRMGITRPLDVLGKSVGAAGAGDLERAIPVVGPPELAHLASAVEQMRLRLLDQAKENLHRSLIVAQDDERRRIAQDIHDDSVQALTVVSLRLQRLARGLSDPQQLKMIHAAEVAASDAIGRLRHLMFELHPPGLERDGIAAALRVYLGETLESAGIEWDLESSLSEEPSRAIQVVTYRLVRESVVNIVKHANANRVRVTLAPRRGGIATTVVDDGVGFDSEAVVELPGHLGISTMAGMANSAGGWWKIHGGPMKGTTVEFWLPDIPGSTQN